MLFELLPNAEEDEPNADERGGGWLLEKSTGSVCSLVEVEDVEDVAVVDEVVAVVCLEATLLLLLVMLP